MTWQGFACAAIAAAAAGAAGVADAADTALGTGLHATYYSLQLP